jgi:hypothetical protein
LPRQIYPKCVTEQFLELFTGLGKLKDNYEIKLKSDAISYHPKKNATPTFANGGSRTATHGRAKMDFKCAMTTAAVAISCE